MADIWDDHHETPAVASGSSKPKISKNVVVREDWELDDDEEEDTDQSDNPHNKRLWEDADAKVHHPMPSLIISRGASTSVALPSLPLNQPLQMRILKRPSPSSLSPTVPTNSSSATGETLKEREARYHAARERIFGTSQQENDDNKKAASNSPPYIVREPGGPDANGGSSFDTKDFSERKAKRSPTVS